MAGNSGHTSPTKSAIWLKLHLSGRRDNLNHQYEGWLRGTASLPVSFFIPPPPDSASHLLAFLSVSRTYPAPGHHRPEHKPFFLPDSLLSSSNLSLISFFSVSLTTSWHRLPLLHSSEPSGSWIFI